MKSRLPLFVGVALVALATTPLIAKVKTRADFDKAFDFKQMHTWGWNPKGAGDIMASRTEDDDPAVVKQRVEPIIMSTVLAEMPKRGLTQASGEPDLTLTYYLLLSIGMASQTQGQFLPPAVAWGIPPFAPSTNSLEVYEQGSLVLDLAAKGQVVWRGVGQAQISMGLETAKRSALLVEAVKEILKKYPPKK